MNSIKRLIIINILTALAFMAPALSFADPSLISPANGATGVSQSPTLVAADFTTGVPTQYLIQVSTNSSTMVPTQVFDQSVARTFATGAFTGTNATISVTNDAYSSVSTGTFVYYSSSTPKLSANTVYYWRAQTVNPFSGTWSSINSFTTGQFASTSPVNHLAISGVSIFGASNTGLANIGFTIAENNVTTGTSTNNGAYNTADWVFIKFSTMSGNDGTWNHATLTGGIVGAGATLTTPSDKKGVYLNHAIVSSYWTAGTTVTWDFGADGVDGKSAIVKVFAIAMVKVPTGSYVHNVNGGNGGSNNYGNGSEATVTGPGTVTGTGTNNLPNGAPVGWPNGYNSFYIGRYEITQGQYADFLNTIPEALASTRFASNTDAGHNMTNAGSYPSKYAAVDRNTAKNYISFLDAWTYYSWAALRPMTVMEFEKAGRDLAPDRRIYPWGTTSVPATTTYIPPNEGATAVRLYLNYNNSGSGKVMNVGRYLSGDLYRTAEQTGASPWGIADLSGNLFETAISCLWTNSVPLNGDGTTTYPITWPAPGSSAITRLGGSWANDASPIQISGRSGDSYTDQNRNYDVGTRAARTP